MIQKSKNKTTQNLKHEHYVCCTRDSLVLLVYLLACICTAKALVLCQKKKHRKLRALFTH